MITDSDYLLGVSDLTGELMRLCINSVATRNKHVSVDVLSFMRKMHDGFTGLPMSALTGELGKKLQVTKESLQKVENVCFNVKVRGSEYPEEMLAQMGLQGDDGQNE